MQIFLFAVAFRSGKRTRTDLDQLDTETGCPNAAGDFHGSGRGGRRLFFQTALIVELRWRNALIDLSHNVRNRSDVSCDCAVLVRLESPSSYAKRPGKSMLGVKQAGSDNRPRIVTRKKSRFLDFLKRVYPLPEGKLAVAVVTDRRNQVDIFDDPLAAFRGE